MKKIPIMVASLLVYLSCSSKETYPWAHSDFKSTLSSAGDKLVLADFETDW